MKKSLFLLPLLAGAMLCGCGETPAPVPTPDPAPEPEHTHTFSAEWSSNSDKHWHMATCGHDVKDAEGAHVDANSDQKCDVCAYPMPVTPPPTPVHTHSWSSSWTSDETNHWKVCSGCTELGEKAAHTFSGDTCSVCGYKKESPVPSGDVVLDFTLGEIDIDKVEDMETNHPFTYDGVEYNCFGCYDAAYGENNYMNFALKKIVGDGKVEDGEALPFIGNAESFGQPIKSIDVDVSVQTGAVDFYVAFGSSAVTSMKAGSVSGTKNSVASSKASSFKVTNSGSGEFFTICASKDVGQYRKNGAIAKLTIHF